jgi:hypothetical protein
VVLLSQNICYDNKHFIAVTNTDNGEVSKSTVFHYHQENDIVWAEYSGGEIVKGFLIGKADRDSRLEFSYQHVNIHSEIRVGICKSSPERLDDGRLRLIETWQWLNGDKSTGSSVVEEVIQS